MKKILFILTITALVMSSCVVKPFKRASIKELELSEQYREVCDSSQNLAQVPWREFFAEPELQSLIDTVLAGNVDYRIALLRVEQSYAMLRASRASIAPSFAAGAGYGTTADFPGGEIANPDLNLQLNMNWEIDIWGKLYSQKESSKAGFWGSEQAAIATRQSLISATATAYFQLVALDAKRDVVERNIESRKAYVETTKELKKSGYVNEVAVQQSIAQLKIAESALTNILMSIDQAESALALLAGRTELNVSRNFDLRSDIKAVELQVGVPVQLLSYRADVRAAEMNYRAKHYLHMAARASLYPSLSISADALVPSIISAHTLVLNGLASLTAPIFQGRKLRAAKQSAEVEAKIAELQFKQSLYTAVVEVNNAMVKIKSSDIMLDYQLAQLEALSKAYSYSDELFLNGYANYLDVLVAQTSLYDSEMATVDAFMTSVLARIELYRAVGGGSDSASVLPESACASDPVIKNSENTQL